MSEAKHSPLTSGWKLVPLKPDQKQIIAGCENNPTQWTDETDDGFAADVANDVYISMVTAAPHPASAAPVPASVREALELAQSAFHEQGIADRVPITLGRIERALASLPAPGAAPADDLEDLVARFSKALLAKLKLSCANGRSGWERDDWEQHCQEGLLRHLAEGDPRDVAAYCAFMWHHSWTTTAPAAAPTREETIEQCAATVRDIAGDAGSFIAAAILAIKSAQHQRQGE